MKETISITDVKNAILVMVKNKMIGTIHRNNREIVDVDVEVSENIIYDDDNYYSTPDGYEIRIKVCTLSPKRKLPKWEEIFIADEY